MTAQIDQLTAKRLAWVLSRADGGCPYCAEDLAKKLNELDLFPGHDFVALVKKQADAGEPPEEA